MTHLSEETLNEYLDDVLSLSARAQADGHLAACLDCRAELEARRGLFAALESLPDVALNRDLSAGVMTALENRAGIPPVVRLAVLVQALAVIAILVLAWPLVDVAVLRLPSLLDLPSTPDLLGWFALQRAAWMQIFTQLGSLPSFGSSFSLDLDPPAILITLTVVSASLLWLVGNGLLLRPRAGSYKRRNS
jgi:hypothetical protein